MPFVKGVAPNPSGLTKEQARARTMAQRAAYEYVERAVRVHVEVMEDKDAPPAARVSAASAILDRAAGKPTTDIAANVRVWDERSDDDIRASLAALDALIASGEEAARGTLEGAEPKGSA